MKIIMETIIIALTILAGGCSTNSTGPTDGPEPAEPSADDLEREYSAHLDAVTEACLGALDELEAHQFDPIVKRKENSVIITAAQSYVMYAILARETNGGTSVWLFFELKSGNRVPIKTLYDDFWASLERHLGDS